MANFCMKVLKPLYLTRWLSLYFIQAKKGDGAQRNISECLKQLLLIQEVKEAVQANGNVVNLRFAADGRRTSNKIGTIMAVFNILEEKNHGCDHQYTVALYNGKDINGF